MIGFARRAAFVTVPLIGAGVFSMGMRQGTKVPSGPPVTVEATAYRPQTEAYNDPFQRRRVRDIDEADPGAGIRINGDDDDGDSIPDRDDPSVPGENDLIEVELWVGRAAPCVEYVLVRTHPSIRVWEEATKESAILGANDEAVLAFPGAKRRVWVESHGGGSALLTFEARATGGGGVLAEDVLRFYSFTGIVIALDGEFQTPTDPPGSVNEGIPEMAIDLHSTGYDVHMYDEDAVAANGSGEVYGEVVDAIQKRGVVSVAMFGFSHGGGSIYDLANLLDQNRASIGAFTIVYTAYIDGLENDSSADLNSEVRLPPTTAFHVNYYQRNLFSLGIWGNSVPGADIDVNVTQQPWGGGILHFTITLSPQVQAGLMDPLRVLVVP